MSNILKFPANYNKHRYNQIHFRFFLEYAKAAGITVKLSKKSSRIFTHPDQLIFSCVLNRQQIIVDFADHSSKNWSACYPGVPYFKFQTTVDTDDKIIPLGPPIVGLKKKGIQVASVTDYLEMLQHFQYTPSTKILCKQLPNGAAVDRRKFVHQLLIDNFAETDTDANDGQLNFWCKHENCLAAVCVPGATNNMVDRGHMELIGLGVCTVSPELVTVFPNRLQLTPGVHYIKCADDYSDLVPILQDLLANPEKCRAVGKAAKNFYQQHYTPENYWKWILENLK